MGEQADGTQVPGTTFSVGFKKFDEFSVSLTEQMEETWPLRFLLGTGGFLLFECPGALAPAAAEGTQVFLRRHLAAQHVTVSFSALVYRLFEQSLLGVPVFILRVSDFFTCVGERRAAPRLALSLPLRYWHRGRVERGVVVDLSANGLRFEGPADAPLDVGEVFLLEFELPDHRFESPFDVEVVRVEPGSRGGASVAVRFLNLMTMGKRKDVWAIDAYIARLLLESAPEPSV